MSSVPVRLLWRRSRPVSLSEWAAPDFDREAAEMRTLSRLPGYPRAPPRHLPWQPTPTPALGAFAIEIWPGRERHHVAVHHEHCPPLETFRGLHGSCRAVATALRFDEARIVKGTVMR